MDYYSSILTFLSLTLILSPLVSSVVPDEKSFLQCLTTNSKQPQFPIADSIFTPTNPTFSQVLNAYIKNARFATPTTPKPLVIVTAKHPAHVQATVICAKSAGLELRIRSGGHDYEGLSYVSKQPFVILDMFNLRAISVDIPTETAQVEAGATMGELYYTIANHSNLHAFPAGVCVTLGAGGHFSGGGYGTLMRKYGLSVDNIIDAEIVNVKGEIQNKAQMGEDLFWAIRGGGGGSFGVILSWKIKLVKVPPIVTVFKVERKIEQGATEIAVEWNQAIEKLDNDLYIRLNVNSVKGEKGAPKSGKVTLVALYLGQTPKLVEIVNQNIPSLKLQPQDCKEMKWVESLLFWTSFPNASTPEVLLNRTTPSATFLKRKSDFVREPLTKEGMEAIWKAVMEVEDIAMAWNPLGGVMSTIPETATPYPHRAGVKFKIQYSGNWKEGGEAEANVRIEKMRKLFEAMSPYATKNPREAFLNYRDIDVGCSNGKWSVEEGKVYGEKYFKGNYERLVDVKTKVDPENFFRNEQSIPPRSVPTTTTTTPTTPTPTTPTPTTPTTPTP